MDSSCRFLSGLPVLAALVAAAVLWGCDECETSRDCGTGQACIDGTCEEATSFDADADGDADSDADSDADADTDGSIVWVAIPGGTYQMGSTDPDALDAQPIHQVTVAGFEMTRSEVTVLQYVGCVLAGDCAEPGTDVRHNWAVDGRQHYPVNYVDWANAAAFCAWAGGRLPSEAEWEYAARNLGQDVIYPWGNEEPSCELAVIQPAGAASQGCYELHSWAVCSLPAGNTEQGLCDMAGNVWEWIADHWHADYEGAPADGSAWTDDPVVTESRVLRGGDYKSGPDGNALKAANRHSFPATGAEPDLGFRCARDGS